MKDQADEPAARSNGPAHKAIALRVINLSKGDRLKLEAVKTAEGQKLIAVTGQRKTSEGEVIDMTPPCLISIERGFDGIIEVLRVLASEEKTSLLVSPPSLITGRSRDVYFTLESYKATWGEITRKIRLGREKYYVEVRQVQALTRALQELRDILEQDDPEVIRPLTSFLEPPK